MGSAPERVHAAHGDAEGVVVPALRLEVVRRRNTKTGEDGWKACRGHPGFGFPNRTAGPVDKRQVVVEREGCP